MTSVTGVGFRARDPDGLKAWYDAHLGIPPDDVLGNRVELWQPADGW
jgi:hypothetical protein